MSKRINGQYFTTTNPFCLPGFTEWAEQVNLKNSLILEPFAGSNNLITMLQAIALENDFVSYDIEPKSKEVKQRDTLLDFPTGFTTCITNPPYLARNSATRRNLAFPKTIYDDLYKLSLYKCLENCENVAAIIPASFINTKLFKNRLSHYILLSFKMFDDTEHPVCLALFQKESKKAKIYENDIYIGILNELEKNIPKPKKKNNIVFNDRNGNLGLIAIDNTINTSIRFCRGEEIKNPITSTSRSLTRIQTKPLKDNTIDLLNKSLNEFREETHDLFLTPFKGLRQDGKYRRRLDFNLARNIINHTI